MGTRAKVRIGRTGLAWQRIAIVTVLALCIVVAGAAPKAWAQDYRFTVDRNLSRVIVNRDGSADVEYWLTYTNDNGAHPIDIVDVGMPNRTYDLSSARAWYSAGAGDGQEYPLTDIRKSEWLSTGVEVHMDEYTIPPGEQGTLHLKINVKEMVYPDSTDEAYASLEFAPHYYEPENVRGKTDMEIQFYFPPGVTGDETRYHDREFDEVDKVDDRIVFIWTYPEASGSETHQHGISFPRTYVDQVYKAPLVIGGTGSGGSGSSFDFSDLTGCGCIGFFALLFIGIPTFGAVQKRKRKLRYLPPSMAVEGVGIKRGLTAVEAALLLEKPLNKVLTMILFGLLKKRAVTVVSDDPLQIELVEPKPEVELREYEEGFVESIDEDGKLVRKKLQGVVIAMVKSLNAKMKGFSRKETVAYYESIVDRAWQQVTAETTPEIKSKYYDQGLEWMMMDDEFDERTQETFGEGPVVMPPWWAHYRPWVPSVRSARTSTGGTSGRSVPSVGGGGRQVTLPTLPGAAFAGAMVSGMERTSGSIVNRLDSFTGGVTQRTNPVPASSRSSSYKSGGCACACACAGCACACAGGGR